MDLGLHPHHLRGNGLHLNTGSSSSKPDTTEASETATGVGGVGVQRQADGVTMWVWQK